MGDNCIRAWIGCVHVSTDRVDCALPNHCPTSRWKVLDWRVCSVDCDVESSMDIDTSKEKDDEQILDIHEGADHSKEPSPIYLKGGRLPN